MEIQAKVKEVNQTQIVSNNFQKRELVIVTNEQYPQTLLVEFHQDKCSLLDNVWAGKDITVSVNINGKEWVSPAGEKKYFTTLRGWKIQ